MENKTHMGLSKSSLDIEAQKFMTYGSEADSSWTVVCEAGSLSVNGGEYLQVHSLFSFLCLFGGPPPPCCPPCSVTARSQQLHTVPSGTGKAGSLQLQQCVMMKLVWQTLDWSCRRTARSLVSSTQLNMSMPPTPVKLHACIALLHCKSVSMTTVRLTWLADTRC